VVNVHQNKITRIASRGAYITVKSISFNNCLFPRFVFSHGADGEVDVGNAAFPEMMRAFFHAVAIVTLAGAEFGPLHSVLAVEKLVTMKAFFGWC
jgi:hypothetical protein